MSLLDLFKTSEPNPDQLVVKTAKSKGMGTPSVRITAGDIMRGNCIDENGYVNEVVLFLRKNKKDR